MKVFSSISFKFIDALLNNRLFLGVFWLIAIGVVAMIGYMFVSAIAPSIELSLLDFKMRVRSSYSSGAYTTMPSKDIVILAVDGNTDKYIRLNPQSGLNVTMPRSKQATVLNYLTDQGAKAVIFDFEFKESKEGDAEFSKAMRRHGHVYAADRMDYSLKPFMESQFQSLGLDKKSRLHVFKETFMYEGLIKPYLSYLSKLRTRFMPYGGVSAADIGTGPFYQPFPNVEGVIGQLAQSLNFARASQHRLELSDSIMYVPPKMRSLGYTDFIERMFSNLCVTENYHKFLQKETRFLELLEKGRLHVELENPIPESIDRNITNCQTLPISPELMESMASIGVPSIKYDRDAYIRSASVLFRGYKGNFYTYLGIRPALDLLDIDTITYSPAALTLNGRRIPLLDGEKILINWRNPKDLVKQMLLDSKLNPEEPAFRELLEEVNPEYNNPVLGGGHIYRLISFIDVLRLAEKQQIPDEETGLLYNIPYHPKTGMFSFKDKIVIVGNTLTDVHRTPMSNTMFGPEVVAAVLDMVLHDELFIQKPNPWMQWSIVAVMATAIAAVTISFESLSIGFTIGAILIIIYGVIDLLLFISLGYWLEVFIPSIVLVVFLILASIYRYYIHDREKHHLTNVFSKYVSPQIMSEIVKNPAKALDNLKGGKKELTVLFSDLQGFTHQFENADPELMVSQLNEYFDVMTEIILDYGGTYDKYMGDSIMAFFGAPTDMPDHAEMACRAAMEMQRSLHELNARWANEDHKLLAHGIGICSGEMFVGNFGSKNIKNFTVMGSNVNLGARLEAYTRVAHWPIIISTRTWELAGPKIEVRDLGKIHVKGFTDVVQIYGLERVEGIEIHDMAQDI